MIYGLEIKDVITFGIAVYGAVVSTLAFRQSRKKERKRVRLRCRNAIRDEDGNFGPFKVIEIINTGQRPVIVDNPQFLAPRMHLIKTFPDAPGYDELPKQLADGEMVSVYVPYDDIRSALREFGYSGKVRLIPICVDQTREQYWGRFTRFNVTDGTRRYGRVATTFDMVEFAAQNRASDT